MSGTSRFGADELGPTVGHELNDAMEVVRALEDAISDGQVSPGPAFSDQVMAAIAHEASPAPGGFLRPLRRGGILGGFAESLRLAWASVATGRPPLVRAAALAYVLVVAITSVSLVSAASFGAASALGLIPAQSTVAPSPEATDAPETTPEAPEESKEPSAEPSEAPEASPDESEGPDDHGGNAPEASDDRGGSSGPGGGDDDRSGPGASGEPDASDDHGGSDDGGSGSGLDD